MCSCHGNFYANLAVRFAGNADVGGMRIFGEEYCTLAGLHVKKGLCLVFVEGDISLGIVSGGDNASKRIRRRPTYGFGVVQWDVYIDIAAMRFQRCVFACV